MFRALPPPPPHPAFATLLNTRYSTDTMAISKYETIMWEEKIKEQILGTYLAVSSISNNQC